MCENILSLLTLFSKRCNHIKIYVSEKSTTTVVSHIYQVSFKLKLILEESGIDSLFTCVRCLDQIEVDEFDFLRYFGGTLLLHIYLTLVKKSVKKGGLTDLVGMVKGSLLEGV